MKTIERPKKAIAWARPSIIGTRFLLIGSFFALSACASFKGAQEPITVDDLHHQICPSITDLQDFKDAADKGEVRDRVVANCIGAIDHNYADFLSALRRDSASINLATDITALGLTTGASLAGGSAAKVLSGTAAAVLGADAAVNKDVFYQKTLPALVSAMNTNRDKILLQIFQSQNSDQTASRYTLERAGHDLWAYQLAGNLDTAVAELTSTALKSEQETKDAVQKEASYKISLLSESVDKRLDKLFDYLADLAQNNKRTDLEAIAGALNVDLEKDEPLDDEFADVRDDIERTIQAAADKDAAMDGVIRKLSGHYNEGA